ncbi:MAG TPA: tol-pal system protein YbgF [Candidatus Krumholzibacteria bacterium]|nr:tol-pal system protein YbgF [Candidatus Krumholzibacteria bacterium]
MARVFFRILATAAAAAALSGCYGAKLVKGPVNSDHAALMADTIRADQRRILDRLDRLEHQMSRDSEERTSFQAQTSVTMSELEEAVRVLVSRIEDTEQLMINRGGRDRSSGSRPAPVASADSVARASEDIYRAAYMDVTRGNYELAAQAFQDYLTQFPDGERVVECRYYLGECNYANERYFEATAEFQRVVTDYPSSRLVPAAYLKMGRAYMQLEERGLAEKAFRTLIEKHPTTEEAKQARTALDEIGG